ncbi:MAG: MoaD/ThiS family protein [Planctomycetota bacterium]
MAGEAATAGAVLESLGKASEALRESLRTSRLAVNHEFAGGDTVIRPGDEVALVGMVSGG